jgi:hypothetical protein
MHFLFLMAALLAAPFWETKPVREWNDEELHQMLTESPWAQTTTFKGLAPQAVYLATAAPMRQAEEEFMRRYNSKLPATQQPTDLGARNEYAAFLAENEGKVLVLALANPNPAALAQAEEMKRLEDESYIKVGRRKIKMTGHFPPAGSDPVLRLVFPRPEEAVKDLVFEFYVPGTSGGYRQAAFRVKDLMFKGKLEM